MFTDRASRQTTLGSFDESATPRSEIVRELAKVRGEHFELLTSVGSTVGELETLVHGAELHPVPEWFKLDVEEQGDLHTTRLEDLTEDLDDRLESSAEFDSEAFGFDHGRLESERRFGYD